MSEITFKHRNEALYKPLKAQADFHGSAGRGRWYVGGVGSGKSACGSVEAIGLSAEYPNNLGLICRKTYPSLRDTTMRTFFDWLEPKFISKWNQTKHELKLTNGSEILFRSFEDGYDQFMSMELGWFWIDEASEVPEKIVQALTTRLRKQNVRRCWYLTGNPGGKDWVWRWFVKEKRRSHEWFHAASTENTHLPADYIESLLDNPDEVWKARYIAGSFDVFEGQIYSEFTDDIHVVTPFAIPDEWPVYGALDHGATNPTSYHQYAVDFDGNIFVFGEYYASGLVSEHAVGIEKSQRFSNRTPDADGPRAIRELYIDPSTRARTLQDKDRRWSIKDEYEENGIITSLANNDVEYGIERVHELLKVDPERIHPITQKKGSPRLHIFRDQVQLIDQIKQYRRDPEKMRPVKYNDHAVDDLRYFCATNPILPTVDKKKSRDDYGFNEPKRRGWMSV